MIVLPLSRETIGRLADVQRSKSGIDTTRRW
jgi:hypothetical protein